MMEKESITNIVLGVGLAGTLAYCGIKTDSKVTVNGVNPVDVVSQAGRMLQGIVSNEENLPVSYMIFPDLQITVERPKDPLPATYISFTPTEIKMPYRHNSN